jgi:hypothetical protein
MNPDYHLVCVFDKDLEECTPVSRDRILYLDERGDIFPMRLRDFNRVRYYATLVEKYSILSAHQRRRYQRASKSLRSTIPSDNGCDVVARIIEGTGHGALLLSTDGGYYKTYQAVRSAMKKLGLVSAFAFENACSAGAYLLSYTDERFSMKDTKFFWHIPTKDGGRPVYRSRLRQFFQENASSAQRSEALRQLNRQLNNGTSRLDVAFSGEQLENFGIVKKAYERGGWLARRFEDCVGARVEDFEEGSPLHSLFKGREDHY